MGTRLPRKSARGIPYDDLAHLVFYSVRPLESKVKLINELAERAITDPGLLKRIKEVMQGVKRTNSTHRSKLLHAKWGVSEDHPDALILFPPQGVKEPLLYAESDFNESLKRIIATGHAIAKLKIEVSEFLKGK
jgi:hypothetical protein